MKTISLPADLVNSILNYLGNQRYVDVAPMINGIMSVASAPTNDSVKTNDTPQ